MADAGARVRDIGEFALIDRLAARLPEAARAMPGGDIGIGDDAALWTPETGHEVVITTDALVDGIHFRLDWTDWRSLGHKMLAVNLSDIASMGAVPRVATVVLGLTGTELVGDLETLYDGAGAIAAAHGVVIAGGDVVRVPHDITISVTLIGEVAAGEAIRRSGARPGDLVVVSGEIGASAAGLALLEEGRGGSATGPLLVGAHLRPNPRVALGRVLHDAGVTAAMDLSDGLLGDLQKLVEASGVSAEVDLVRLPIPPPVRAHFPDRFEQLALRGGEDYELLMTIPGDRWDAFVSRARDVGATLSVVGRIEAATGTPGIRLVRNGVSVEMGPGAFDHFRQG